MVALHHAALPRGGRLKVDIASAPGSIEASVTAEGQDVHLRPEALAGLKDNIDLDEMTPRGVHGYFTRLVARRLGSDIVIETPGPDALLLRVVITNCGLPPRPFRGQGGRQLGGRPARNSLTWPPSASP